MTPTWTVWSPIPPEAREKVSCNAMLDAARAWAERQFRRGFVVRSGTEVLVKCDSDPLMLRPMRPGDTRMPMHMPDSNPSTVYQVRIELVNAPAFRARLSGLVNEAVNGEPTRG